MKMTLELNLPAPLLLACMLAIAAMLVAAV